MKDKEIEEMAKEMSKELCCYYDKQKRKCSNCFGMEEDCDLHCNFGRTLERLSNAGYRKLPKDSVVLSKEEYEKLKNESIDKLFADDTFFKEEFKANEEYLRKRANRDYIKLVKKQASKETAGKILNEQYQECKVAEQDVLKARGSKNDAYYKGFSLGMTNTKMHIKEIATREGVEIKE